MSYIDKTLGRNEKVLYRAHIHSLFYLRIWALFFALIALIGWLRFTFDELIGTPLAIMLIAAAAFYCLRLIVPLWMREIVLTNLRIVQRGGLLVRATHEYELRAIEAVNLRQSLLGRILGYGRIEVNCFGDAPDLILEGIADPLTFRREIASAAQRLSESSGNISIASMSLPKKAAAPDQLS